MPVWGGCGCVVGRGVRICLRGGRYFVRMRRLQGLRLWVLGLIVVAFFGVYGTGNGGFGLFVYFIDFENVCAVLGWCPNDMMKRVRKLYSF